VLRRRLQQFLELRGIELGIAGGQMTARLGACRDQIETCANTRIGNALQRRKFITTSGRSGAITESGLTWCRAEGIDFDPSWSPHCRLCNDWTERGPHLSGPLPNAILKRLVATHCVASLEVPRALRVTPKGRAFFDRLGVELPL
jgi:hypothetical protein